MFRHPGIPHLYELGTLAALYQPCLLGDLDYTMSLVLGNPLLAAGGRQRCAALVAAGQLERKLNRPGRESGLKPPVLTRPHLAWLRSMSPWTCGVPWQ